MVSWISASRPGGPAALAAGKPVRLARGLPYTLAARISVQINEEETRAHSATRLPGEQRN
jgi:hypothetical protein